MKITIDIDLSQNPGFMGWGADGSGLHFTALHEGKKILIHMTPAEAREVSCMGIYAATSLAMAAQQQAPASSSSIIGPNGLPILTGRS